MNIDSTNIETLAKRYVLGQLDEGQAEEFETYYFSRPELIEMVDAIQKIHIGMENTEFATVYADQALAGPSTTHSLVNKLAGWIKSPMPGYALAATIALVAFGPATLLSSLSSSSKDTSSLGELQLVRLDTSSVRSANAVQTINLSVPDGKSAALLVRVKDVEFPNYRLKVSSSDKSELLWASKSFHFASGSRDYLFVVPSEAALDNVHVELFGINQKSQELSVPFCNYTEACF